MADGPNFALRVSQLDAAELDSEIYSLTKSQLARLFKYQKGNFLVNYEPEISAAIKFLLWKFSISTIDSTLGQSMLRLKYHNEHAQTSTNQWISNRQKKLYAWLLIGCPWFKDRSHDLLKLLHLQKWEDQVDKVLRWLETGFKLASLVNFLVFLRHGVYLHVIERLLGVRASFPERQGMRQVTFEFMTRELLWHGFSELLFFLLPLINFQKIKNFILKQLSSATNNKTIQNASVDLTSCAVCGNWPIRPQEIGCSHVFCHYCIHSHIKADPGFRCPLCSHRVEDKSSIQNATVVIQHRTNIDDER